jgi:hypothetical protein
MGIVSDCDIKLQSSSRGWFSCVNRLFFGGGAPNNAAPVGGVRRAEYKIGATSARGRILIKTILPRGIFLLTLSPRWEYIITIEAAMEPPIKRRNEMTYTVSAYNYSHSDSNEPYFNKDYENKDEAIQIAREKFAHLASFSYGRVSVAPVNPATGYNDLPPIWKREKSYPVH